MSAAGRGTFRKLDRFLRWRGRRPRAMKFVQKLFESAHVLIVAMFFISAVTLVVFSIGELWGAIRPTRRGRRCISASWRCWNASAC